MTDVGTFADGPSASGLGPDEAGVLLAALVQTPAATTVALLFLVLALGLTALVRATPVARIGQAATQVRIEASSASLYSSLSHQEHKPDIRHTHPAYKNLSRGKPPLIQARAGGHILDLRDLRVKSDESLGRGPP
jgi:hypothetical protein